MSSPVGGRIDASARLVEPIEGDVLVRRRLTLEPHLASAGLARRSLRDALIEAGRGQWAEAAELACTEVVSNAVLHAHTVIELGIEVAADSLRVAVRDLSPVLPVRRDYDAQATTGRGMALVAAVSQDHGVADAGPDGKTVWFTIAGEPALVLYLAEHDGLEVDLAATDRARTTISTALQAAVDQAPSTAAEPAGPPEEERGQLLWVPAPLDLPLAVPAELGPAFGAMQDALDAAERLAVAGLLLVSPGLPEIIAVRDWACEQVIAQLAGVTPSVWPGAAQHRFTTQVHGRAGEYPTGWDMTAVRDSDRGVVAADDANRIIAISRPLAQLLGWDVQEIVGQRVVALIPPRLREAHVAGFSRHLSTGEAHLLGEALTLPALRANGTEVECRFLIEHAYAERGRSVYLARVEPARLPDVRWEDPHD